MCVCVCVYPVCPSSPPDNDLEPGLFGAGDKEPCADRQLSLGCGPLHVFQHGWQPARHHLQGQEGSTDGAAFRKPAAGETLSVCVCVCLCSGGVVC